MSDAAGEQDPDEAERRRVLRMIGEWAEEDPRGLRLWLGEIADKFLAAAAEQET